MLSSGIEKVEKMFGRYCGNAAFGSLDKSSFAEAT